MTDLGLIRISVVSRLLNYHLLAVDDIEALLWSREFATHNVVDTSLHHLGVGYVGNSSWFLHHITHLRRNTHRQWLINALKPSIGAKRLIVFVLILEQVIS